MDSIRQQMEAEKDAALSKQEEITRATAEELEHAKEVIIAKLDKTTHIVWYLHHTMLCPTFCRP